MVKVSVIVPIYGAEKYIASSARSILGQTWENTEFIFVNDGTPDRSIYILKELIDTEFRNKKQHIILLEKENEGAPMARHRGLEVSSGDYILFADSDDTLEPEMVEKLALAACGAGADVAYCGFYKEKGSGRGRVCRERLFDSSEEYAREMLAYHAYGYLWNKLLHRSLFKGRYATPRYGMHDDMVLLCQILPAARKLVRVDEPLYHYRCDNAASLSHRRKALRDVESARNFLSMIQFWEGEERVPFQESLPLLYARAGWAAYKYDPAIWTQFSGLEAHVMELDYGIPHPFRLLRMKLWLHARLEK